MKPRPLFLVPKGRSCYLFHLTPNLGILHTILQTAETLFSQRIKWLDLAQHPAGKSQTWRYYHLSLSPKAFTGVTINTRFSKRQSSDVLLIASSQLVHIASQGVIDR